MLLKGLIPVKGNCSFENRLLQREHSLCAIVKNLPWYISDNKFWNSEKNVVEVNIDVKKY